VLADAVLCVGRQVARHAARAWLDIRRDCAERDAELIDLVAVSVRDQFHRCRLARHLQRQSRAILDAPLHLHLRLGTTCGPVAGSSSWPTTSETGREWPVGQHRVAAYGPCGCRGVAEVRRHGAAVQHDGAVPA
jgi:hypothetical protein